MEPDIGECFRDLRRSGYLPNGDCDHDSRILAARLGSLDILKIRDLDAIVAEYASTLYTRMPWPLPPPLLTDQKVQSCSRWGDLAVKLPIGSVGLLQTMVHHRNDREQFYLGREVPFVVVDKPANPSLGTINVVILKLQRLCQKRLETGWTYVVAPEDLSDDDQSNNRFAAVELWLDPNHPVQTCKVQRKFLSPSFSIGVGADDRYRLPIVRFIDTSGDAGRVADFWTALANRRPEVGESHRWYDNIQSVLQKAYTDRLAFHFYAQTNFVLSMHRK